MAIHRKRQEHKPGARMLLESEEAVELPAADVNREGITLEREEFRPHLEQLLELLEEGVTAQPAPVVMSDSIFVIDGETRSYWVRLWHLNPERTQIDRMHLSSCVPRISGLKIPSFK